MNDKKRGLQESVKEQKKKELDWTSLMFEERSWEHFKFHRLRLSFFCTGYLWKSKHAGMILSAPSGIAFSGQIICKGLKYP